LQKITYKNATISVTMSFGVAALPVGKKPTAEEFIRQADEALYRAKGVGRNRCCVAGRE